MQNEITNTIQIAKEQNNFLETTIGKLINTGINTGLRVLLPDLILQAGYHIVGVDGLLSYCLIPIYSQRKLKTMLTKSKRKYCLMFSMLYLSLFHMSFSLS